VRVLRGDGRLLVRLGAWLTDSHDLHCRKRQYPVPATKPYRENIAPSFTGNPIPLPG